MSSDRALPEEANKQTTQNKNKNNNNNNDNKNKTKQNPIDFYALVLLAYIRKENIDIAPHWKAVKLLRNC